MSYASGGAPGILGIICTSSRHLLHIRLLYWGSQGKGGKAMNTRQKMIGLAALPLAGLLAMGGTALAQTAGASAGAPASTRVVHAVKADDKPVQQRLHERERDRETRGDHREARSADRGMDRHSDGSQAERADR